MGWLITLGVIALLAVFPLGISLKYQQPGLMAWVLIGPIRIRVYPEKQTREENDSQPKHEHDGQPQQDSGLKAAISKAKAQTEKESGGSWTDFLPLLGIARDFLGDLRRKIRVRYLKLDVTLAGEDPCDLAINYGRMNAALSGILVQVHRLFLIRKQDIRLQCDFDAEQTVVDAELAVTITLGRAVYLLARYGVQGLKTYYSMKKQQEGGAEL